jgi:hypothetical protein
MVLRPLLVFLAALVLVPTASAAAPTGLKGFLLHASEAVTVPHTFARTPSFAWSPVSGADRYEFELATSSRFAENAIVWETSSIKGPVTHVPLTLPWITGSSYSWYARVRAVVDGTPTRWSSTYGFNMVSPAPPASLSSGPNPTPGMVRWTPVEGATAYEVVFHYNQANGDKKQVRTATTAADLREFYTFHHDPADFGDVYWRVRAVRQLEGNPLNKIPVVSYGRWSGLFVTTEPPIDSIPIDLQASISRSGASDVVASDATGAVHALVPGFRWTGRYGLPGGFGDCWPDVAATGVTCPLYHVYVYTDSDCVNRVHESDLVGSPAYVPRLTNPLDLPDDPSALATATGLFLGDAKEEGAVWDAGGDEVKPAGGAPNRTTGLWDVDWPGGRYYWTAVPSVPRITVGGSVEYNDVAFGSEMCQAGEVLPFGKTSEPVIERASSVPYVSGLTSSGAVRGASTDRPSFYGRVVVAWKPAPGARKYQIQWSKKDYPWSTAGTITTASTAAGLNLPDGVWYYRVRGIDTTIPGTAQGMTWTDPQYVRILPRTFSVVG